MVSGPTECGGRFVNRPYGCGLNRVFCGNRMPVGPAIGGPLAGIATRKRLAKNIAFSGGFLGAYQEPPAINFAGYAMRARRAAAL